MNASIATTTWQSENQRYLVERLAVLRWMLEHHIRDDSGSVNGTPAPDVGPWRLERPPALETLASIFGLTAFEQEIVLLCAGIELDSRVAPLCAAAQAGDEHRPYPTFGLALALSPDAHWSALTPASPLRYWNLVTCGPGGLTSDRITIDERILHYLAGVSYLDDRLASLVQPVHVTSGPISTASHEAITLLGASWDRSRTQALCVSGSDFESRREVAAAACAARELNLFVISATTIPADPQQRDLLVRLWDRESALSGVALLIECDTIDPSDSQRWDAVRAFAEQSRSAVLLSTNERQHPSLMRFPPVNVELPSNTEQEILWRASLSDTQISQSFTRKLVAQFDLPLNDIRRMSEMATIASPAPHEFETTVWNLCRSQSRQRMPHLAQRLTSNATWNDLILPNQQLDVLHEVATHVRQRSTVYDDWGFADRYSRGLGISLLCTGPSGTGKTLAAEVLANELDLDLYRIELSEVISKYIGETEKNLAQVFAAAEACGAMLLFDEAESIFGKRTDVRDSHDRYANIEVAYLLQRMESFRGLSILTTNLKDALDVAFMRRIRFVVQFPYPDLEDRARIWRQVLPAQTPRDDLDYDRLARLNLSGGLIRNVAMNAAFLAAEDGQPVAMRHLATAARREHAKQGKPLNEHEIGSWV